MGTRTALWTWVALVMAAASIMLACDTEDVASDHETRPVGTPTPPPREGTQAMQRAGQAMEREIDLYLFGASASRFDDAVGEFAADDEGAYWRMNKLLALVAVRRLAAEEGQAAALVAERLAAWGDATVVDGAVVHHTNESDERGALLELLGYLGRPGQRAIVRFWQPSAPSSSDDDEWIRYLRRDAEKRAAILGGEPTRGATFGDPLLWQLTGDEKALARLASEIDERVTQREAEPPADNPGLAMRSVLRVAPVGRGVADAKLREWLDQQWATEVQWGAALALLRRGEADGAARVREIVRQRLALAKSDPLLSTTKNATWHLGFQFVLGLADSPLDDRWDLLADLIEDTRPDVLIPRAAALLAFDDHWEDLPDDQASRAIDLIDRLHWNEDNSWLQAEMMGFLARHADRPT